MVCSLISLAIAFYNFKILREMKKKSRTWQDPGVHFDVFLFIALKFRFAVEIHGMPN